MGNVTKSQHYVWCKYLAAWTDNKNKENGRIHVLRKTASSGFLAIGESSVGTPQRLTEVFDGRNLSSKSSIASAFEQMKNIGNSIQQKYMT